MTLRKLLPLVLFPLAAFAERPAIDLNGARIQAYPIALSKPLGAQDAGNTVQAVLAQDFERSGFFKLLDPTSFLANQEKEGLANIDFPSWVNVGAQALVKMKCESAATAAADHQRVLATGVPPAAADHQRVLATGVPPAAADHQRVLGTGVPPAAAETKCELRLYDVGGARELLHGTYSAPHAALRQIAHRFADDVVKAFTQEPGVFQTRIAYVRETEGGKQLVVADSDGFGPQALTGASINLLPAWTPDGRTIAFTSFRDGGGAHIYTVDVASRQIRPLVLMGDFATGAAYAPDGLRFTFSTSLADNTDVYVSQSDGSAGRRLTDARGIDISATWSPDGKRIAFISERSGSPQVYTMLADGSQVKRVTYQGNYNQEPAWSPKGDLIAFSGRDEKRVFDIYTVNVDSGKVARLTQAQGTNEKPSWSPNGRYLIFSSTRTGKRQIWSMSSDGSNQRQLTSERLGASDPAWGPLPAGR